MRLPDHIIIALEKIAHEASEVAALIDTKADYRIVWVNRKLEELLKPMGVSPVGMRWGGRCPFAYGINAVEVMDKVAETGQPIVAEEKPFSARVSSRFGETTYWNWKCLPAATEECPGCVLVMAENVTDHVARKAAEGRRKAIFSGVVLDLPVGVAIVSSDDFRIMDANDIFLSYLSTECQSRDSIGKPLSDCLPASAYSGLAVLFRHVATTGELYAGNEYEIKDPRRGSTWWNLTIRPVEMESGGEALLVTVWDVTEQVGARLRLERSRRRAQAMIRIQQAISASLAIDEVISLITNSARELMNSAAASVFLFSPDMEEFIPMGATGIEMTEASKRALSSEKSLAARSLRERRPVSVSEEEVTEFARLSRLTNGHPITAIAASPIEAENTQIGVIEVYNDGHRRFSNEDLETLYTFANMAAIGIVNARLFEETERNRRELEVRNRIINNERKLLKAILESIPDAVSVVDTECRLIQANAAARSLLEIEEGKTAKISDVLNKLHPMTADGKDVPPEENPFTRALRGEEFRNLELTLHEHNGHRHYRSVSGSSVRDRDGNIIFGVVVGRDITEQKLMQVKLEEAYERERRIAQTFQQAMLSEIPREMDGLQMATIYEAGLREAELGGDFFDVFTPAEGKLAIVIGDVAGKGLDAAIQIAAAKYAIRGFAYEDPAPSHVAARTNNFLYRERSVGGFITVFYGLVDVKTKTITYTNAGHEPPLLRHPDGRVDMLLSNGLVLGVKLDFEYQERQAELESGDKLLLYTDGITEARKESGELLGEDRLAEFWARNASIDGAEPALRTVYQWAKDFSEGHFHDDVAMLVVVVE